MKTRRFLEQCFPFRRKHLFVVAILVGLAGLALDVCVQAASISAACAKCEHISCGSRVVYDSDGYVKGCEEEWIGDDCTDDCWTCTGATVDYHCEHHPGETCYSDTGMPSTSCGTKTYYNCQGNHHPDCTCNTSGTATASSDSCSIKTCS